jgi:erythritol transport system ATP-binding protein
LRSVRDAQARGIGIIHQELNLCPNLSVAENIFLGRELSSRGLLDRRAQEERARKLLAHLEHPIDPRALVGDLPLGQQQIVEIAKALAGNVRVLMMDEPTSALSASEIAVLFRIIGELKARGVAIVYISHRIQELLGVADRVSVLRDGRLVAEAETAGVDMRWVVEQMTGRLAAAALRSQTSAAGSQATPELLRVEKLSLLSETGRPLLKDVSFSLQAGEVLGIYGLMGAGRTELLECLMGSRAAVAGSVLFDSKDFSRSGTAARISAGLTMVPEDRQTSGLVQSLSVLANMTLSSLSRFTRGVWLSPGAEKQRCGELAADLSIRHPGLAHSIESLSGGNQQKVVLAKCLMTGPRVLLLDEPTRGVDVAAKREIHAIIRRLAAGGMGIVLVSSELEEVLAGSDRILVLSRGEVTAEFPIAEAAPEALAAAASAAVEERTEQP